MLPIVTLKDVSRSDVDRVSWWLEDEDVSARWFGHYACGDPIHRGYDPQHMIEAPERDWIRVFGDSQRRIYSIYTPDGEHVGEAQALFDSDAGAEISLLIGLKDLWHHGYGTATALDLLDMAFGEPHIKKVWVNIPKDNAAALGLFLKLGFTLDGSREICKRTDGSSLETSILTITSDVYLERQPARWKKPPNRTVVTVTGLPGSESEIIAEQVASALDSKFVNDDQIRGLLQERLRCSPGELDAFEASHSSWITRVLRSMAVPMRDSAPYEGGPLLQSIYTQGHRSMEDTVTLNKYLEAIKAVIKGLVVKGGVVIHGHGSHLFVPTRVDTLNIFISATSEDRQKRIASASANEISTAEAREWIRQTDKQARTVFKNLFDTDLLDMERYDLVVNADRVPSSRASEVIVGALKLAVLGKEPGISPLKPLPEIINSPRTPIQA